MVRKEGLRYAFTGIPLGLIAGLLIGFIVYPKGFQIKTVAIYAVLIAIVGVVMVNIAIFKPVRVAMNTSPIEGARYLAYSGKAKPVQSCIAICHPTISQESISSVTGKSYFDACDAGRKRCAIAGRSTVAYSIDPEKQATFKHYPAGSILLQVKNQVGSSFDKESEPYGSSKLQLEENPLESQTLRHDLENIAGVEK